LLLLSISGIERRRRRLLIAVIERWLSAVILVVPLSGKGCSHRWTRWCGTSHMRRRRRIVVAGTIGGIIYVVVRIPPFPSIAISICTTTTTTRCTCTCHILLLLLLLRTREAGDIDWMEVCRDISAIFRSHWLVVVVVVEGIVAVATAAAHRTIERLLLLWWSRRIRWLLG